MSCEACCLARVGGSENSHKADPVFHAITKVPRILDASTVLMMDMYKGVKEAHPHDSILEASQEHLGGQVMQEMVSSWKYSCLSPKISKHIVQTRAFAVMRERKRDEFIRASMLTQLFVILSVILFKLCIERCRGCEEHQQ